MGRADPGQNNSNQTEFSKEIDMLQELRVINIGKIIIGNLNVAS